MEGLLTYLHDEEEGEELRSTSPPVSLEANEAEDIQYVSSLPPLPSFPPPPPPFLSLPIAYTSQDTTVRPKRRPRATEEGEGGRKKKRRSNVRWSDPALLEEVFPFYADRPADPTAPPEGIDPPSPPPSRPQKEEAEDDETAAFMRSLASITSSSSTNNNNGGGGNGGGSGGGLKHSSWETVSVVTRKKASPLDTSSSHPPLEGKWATVHTSSYDKKEKEEEEEGYDPALFEFFCDMCNFTLEHGEVRYECKVCAQEEYSLCRGCYSSSSSSHPHPLVPNTEKIHVTRLKKEQEKEKNKEEKEEDSEEEEEEGLLGLGSGRFGRLKYEGSL